MGRAAIKLSFKVTDTTVTNAHGVGPIVACYLLGYSGDVRRFPNGFSLRRLRRDDPDLPHSSRQ
ncbi:MAG: hypothetical protein QOI08_1246 [Actinomycetota bacterium]|nr:hypothetical protein [Actinomycetota bacterium]